MKSAAGPIRLDLAQYREMEVFTQFSSDLDETTKRQLTYGQGLMELLKQRQYHPRKQYEQVVLLVAATERVLQGIPVARIKAFAEELLGYIGQKASALCEEIGRTGVLSQEGRQKIIDLSRELAKNYMQGEEQGR